MNKKKDVMIATRRIESNIDVEIQTIVEDQVQDAVQKVTEELSKKYFRNIEVAINVKVK